MDAICVEFGPQTPFDVNWFQNLVRRLPEVQQRIFKEATQRGAVQSGYTRVLDRIVKLGRSMLVAHCKRLDLGQRTQFLVGVLPQIRGELSGDLVLQALRARRHGCAAFRDAVLVVEHLLGAKVLTECPGVAIQEFRLEATYESPQVAFQQEFQGMVQRTGMTQREFAAAHRHFGVNQILVSEAVRGKRVPSRDCEITIQILAELHAAPGLLQAFRAARAKIEAMNPAACAHEALQSNAVALRGISTEMALIEEIAPKIFREARGRQMAKSTLKNYRKSFGSLRAAAISPNNPALAEHQRGCGLDPDLHGLLSCLRIDVLERMIDRAAAKRGAALGNLSRSDATTLGPLRALLAPRTGILWVGAEQFIAASPGEVATLPTHWPKSADADEPGAMCRSPVSRVRALCLALHPWIVEKIGLAQSAPCSPRHLEDLGPVRAAVHYPMTGLFVVLQRAKLSRSPELEDKVHQALISNFFALSMHTTQRIGKGITTTMHEVTRNKSAEFVLRYGPVEKNPYSPHAKIRLDTLPREINPYAAPYHQWRITHGSQAADAAYYITPDGRPLTEERLRYMAALFFKQFGEDLFPHALEIQHLRHIATTEACLRCGQTIGLQLATRINRHAPRTSAENYLLESGIPDFLAPGTHPTTQNELLRAVIKAARRLNRRLNFTMRDRVRLRRTTYQKKIDEGR